ncbi:DNA polymerase III subunit epsilon [Alkalicaulis satelles]|uniref:DNA polymerase III subunit epsilon n=1 Tax=Alkalicaulis satelles TaxID=2609175 RepID=A0A5M6ZNM6_9PROT|nr:DNA polymerase III subunit epsilon [Alkalicaulis satelles]KAA5803831.1 DNA polymerase III subunit epsilon [Alkalicaulis satelles]
MSQRQVVFDTETTGLYHDQGDRITEIGCVELIGMTPTGRDLRLLVNPERDVDAEAVRITGLTNEMLKDQPVFAQIADQVIDFFEDSEIIAHNAGFDMGFINMELERCGREPIAPSRFIDSAALAREKFPGAPASLDALCKRFDISLESRTKHGALIDAYLLAEVWLELHGGREQALGLLGEDRAATSVSFPARPPRPTPLETRISPAEAEAHAAFIAGLDDSIWAKLDGRTGG